MNKKKLRNNLKFCLALFFFWLYIPHFICLINGNIRSIVVSDISNLKKKYNISYYFLGTFLYFLHNNRYYRTLFYYRIGPVISSLISWWRPGDRYFTISPRCEIGEGVIFAHPYGTIINADKIGKNFSFIHLTTIGSLGEKRPVIGDNVELGAGVIIIGDVKIGNNVKVGAGSVVVKDLPDNCVAVGNPAKVIKFLELE